jgi:hypothetical protein
MSFFKKQKWNVKNRLLGGRVDMPPLRFILQKTYAKIYFGFKIFAV